MINLRKHDQTCTPITPCKACLLVQFMREKLKDYNADMLSFERLLREAGREQLTADVPWIFGDVHSFGLCEATTSQLTQSNIFLVGAMARKTNAELLTLGFTDKMVHEISEKLTEKGLVLGMYLPDEWND